MRMKKYQQLLLAILSIISFSCLLIYRHEYNKLRYVLEVLNFFGTPGVTAPPPLVCSLKGEIPISTDPLPAWQRVSNSLYIYSAFWEKIEDKEHVKAFAIGILNENLNYGCYLWYDTEPRTKVGQFSFSGIASKPQDLVLDKTITKSRTKAFVFYCEAGSERTPVGVTFFKTSANETTQGFLPITHLPRNPPPQNSTGICVMPTPFPSFNKSIYLEFLVFHKILNTNGFIAYGANDQHHLLTAASANRANKINLTILQWNYPFYGDAEIMRIVAENDCLTRTLGLYENVIILDWNKFFVPRYILSISNILNDLDHDKKAYKFQITKLLFCSEFEDNPKSNLTSPTILKKIRYSTPKVDIPTFVYRPYKKNGKVQKVGKSIIAIHQYTSCREIRIKSGDKKSDRIENAMLRFQNKLLQSKLLTMPYSFRTS